MTTRPADSTQSPVEVAAEELQQMAIGGGGDDDEVALVGHSGLRLAVSAPAPVRTIFVRIHTHPTTTYQDQDVV